MAVNRTVDRNAACQLQILRHRFPLEVAVEEREAVRMGKEHSDHTVGGKSPQLDTPSFLLPAQDAERRERKAALSDGDSAVRVEDGRRWHHDVEIRCGCRAEPHREGELEHANAGA